MTRALADICRAGLVYAGLDTYEVTLVQHPSDPDIYGVAWGNPSKSNYAIYRMRDRSWRVVRYDYDPAGDYTSSVVLGDSTMPDEAVAASLGDYARSRVFRHLLGKRKGWSRRVHAR